MMKNLYKSAGLLIVFFALLFSGCNMIVSLGDKLDMNGPVVSVTKPESMQNVADGFVLEGTVSDESGVESLTVSLSGVSRQWENTGGAWMTRASESSGWEAYNPPLEADGVPVPRPKWDNANGIIHWSIPLFLVEEHYPDGEYTIAVYSVDKSKNSSAKSRQEVLINFINEPPLLQIISPASAGGAKDSVPEALMGYSLENLDDIEKLCNNGLEIRYTISLEAGVTVKDMEFKLLDKDDNCYYAYPRTNISGSGGTITIGDSEICFPAADGSPGSKPVSEGEDVQKRKVYLQMYTRVWDTAGNVEEKYNGWICYWPDSDKPWVSLPSSNWLTPGAVSIYGGTDTPLSFYDNTGLGSVYYKVEGASGTDYTNEVNTIINSPRKEYTLRTFNPPSAPGTYTITLRATDENGLGGEPKTGYFRIIDKNFPAIDIKAPDSQTTDFGGDQGSINFSGYAFDNGAVNQVEVAWINPAPSSGSASENLLDYLNYSSPSWEAADASSSPLPYTDGKGNKVWKFKPDMFPGQGWAALENLPSFPTDSSLSHQDDDWKSFKKFSVPINLFNDLGIDGLTRYFKDQNFVIRAVDNEQGGGNKTITQYRLKGDSEEPKLAIIKVLVYRSEGTEEYDPVSSPPLAAIAQGVKVSLSGTWTDDSITRGWSKDRMGVLSLTWAGNTSVTAGGTLEGDGTWTTEQFIPPSGAMAAVSASLSDWGGNVGTGRIAFLVESNDPQLQRISCDEDDGVYRDGKTLNIYLDFNKEVTFRGGYPELELNNTRSGKTPVLSYNPSKSGGLRHYFTYTVDSGQDADIAKLDVTQVILPPGGTCKDVAQVDANLVVIAGANSLTRAKVIQIDNTPPEIQSLAAVTTDGSFRAGSVLYLALLFNEAVTVTGETGDLRLGLNSGSGVYAVYNPVSSTAQRLLFDYEVEAGHNASALRVTSLSTGGAVIRDTAGNLFVTNPAPAVPNGGTLDKTYVIDTTPPGSPRVEGVTASPAVKYEEQTFSVARSGADAEDTLDYSIDNGKTWLRYTGPVTITTNGHYEITARQTDKAGNVSAPSAAVRIDIDKGNLLNRISSSTVDGLYTTGKEINIVMYFRKAVKVSGSNPRLALNSGSGRYAVHAINPAASASAELSFSYTVQEGDAADPLNVMDVDFTGVIFRDENDTDVTSGVDAAGVLADSSGQNLKDQRNIQILTGNPSVTSVSYSAASGGNPARLTITFDRDVYKGAGSITVTQHEASYIAPAVLDETRFNRLNGLVEDDDLSEYYTLGTNGATRAATGDAVTPDTTTKKYILQYRYNGNDTTLTNLFKNNDLHKVTVGVTSNAVKISEANRKVMTVDLTGAYELLVLGTNYKVGFDNDLITDQLSHKMTGAYSDDVTVPGINPPVIRVQKESERTGDESYLYDAGNGVIRARQPFTTKAKIDCQTPGVTLSYKLGTLTLSTDVTGNEHSETFRTTTNAQPGNNTGQVTGTPPTINPENVPLGDFTGTSYISGIDLGADNTNGTDTTFAQFRTIPGIKHVIWARASKDGDSVDAYEAAFRSVFIYRNVAELVNLEDGGADLPEQIWLRGGDSPTGSTLTPGHPLSWDTSDHSPGPSKAKLMTSIPVINGTTDRGTDAYWYYVTWDITVKTYVGFFAGSTPNTLDEAKLGPTDWAWFASGVWPYVEYYPVFPGESRLVRNITSVQDLLLKAAANEIFHR